jgi:hypothetical protein
MRLTRLVLAPLFALSLIVSIAETMAEDACDRDASTVAMRATDADGGGESPRNADGHLVHLCHCVHAHVGSPATRDARDGVPSLRLEIASGESGAPASADRAPPFRPPARIAA